VTADATRSRRRRLSGTPGVGADDLARHGRPTWQPAPVGRRSAAGCRPSRRAATVTVRYTPFPCRILIA